MKGPLRMSGILHDQCRPAGGFHTYTFHPPRSADFHIRPVQIMVVLGNAHLRPLLR